MNSNQGYPHKDCLEGPKGLMQEPLSISCCRVLQSRKQPPIYLPVLSHHMCRQPITTKLTTCQIYFSTSWGQCLCSLKGQAHECSLECFSVSLRLSVCMGEREKCNFKNVPVSNWWPCRKVGGLQSHFNLLQFLCHLGTVVFPFNCICSSVTFLPLERIIGN